MSDKREWFYPAGDGSESVGPLTTEQVAEKLRLGELKVDDYIWGTHFSDQDWRRIFELEELRAHLPVRQAPKPRMAPPPRAPKPDDEEATLVDNPIQREKDHPDIAEEKTDPGFVKALAEAPGSEPMVKVAEAEPEIIRSVPVPTATLTMDDAERAKIAITVSEVPAPELNERRSIEAPTGDFFSEIEQTNPSILFKRDPEPSQEISPPSGVREMTLDSFIAKTEAAQPPAAPPPSAPPPAAPVPVIPPPMTAAPPPAPPSLPPMPPLPALEENTALTPRPSSENTVLTQRPPELAPPEPLPPLQVAPGALDATLLTQPTITQSLPFPTLDQTQLTQPAQPMPELPAAPEPVVAPPTSSQDTVIIHRGPEPGQRESVAAPLAPAALPPLEDDKTIPSVESLLGHVRAQEPKAPEPAPPPPPPIAPTLEPVSTINFTPVLEEPVTSVPPSQTSESRPTQELKTNTQTKTPSSGTHMGGGSNLGSPRVAGTGSHMSTRTGNTNFGGGQSRFTTPKQEAFHAQTDDFKATHDEPGEYGTENAYRRYPRVPFNTEVIMRDDREYHRFRSIDISEKGVRIKVEDISLFNKGEEITITVRSAPGIGTFSCKGVVMRILRADEGPGYGIFFMQLNPNIRRRITQFVLDQMSARLNRSATRGGPAAA